MVYFTAIKISHLSNCLFTPSLSLTDWASCCSTCLSRKRDSHHSTDRARDPNPAGSSCYERRRSYGARRVRSSDTGGKCWHCFSGKITTFILYTTIFFHFVFKIINRKLSLRIKSKDFNLVCKKNNLSSFLVLFRLSWQEWWTHHHLNQN